jgi:cytochrome c556
MKKDSFVMITMILVIGLYSSSLFAQQDSAFLGYRQSLMKSLGSQMGAIGHILKSGLPLKQNIASHAQIITINAKLLPAAFEKKITAGRTDATPAIWQKWSQFEKAAMAAQNESQKLMKIAASGSTNEFFAQMKNLGMTCGGCHKGFRKPKHKRFKR